MRQSRCPAATLAGQKQGPLQEPCKGPEGKTHAPRNFFRDHLAKHEGANEKDPRNAPLSRSDYELLPTIWRSPDRISKSEGRDHLELDALDGGVLHLFVSSTLGIRSFYKERNPGGA